MTTQRVPQVGMRSYVNPLFSVNNDRQTRDWGEGSDHHTIILLLFKVSALMAAPFEAMTFFPTHSFHFLRLCSDYIHTQSILTGS